jgi:hypothetical protein
MLCLITDIKTRLGIGAEFDTILTAIVAGTTGLFEAFCNRKLILPAANVTEYLPGGGEFIQLRCYPIVSITTLKETYGDFDFTNATALVANTDYRIVAGGMTGIIQRMYTAFPDGLDAVQAVYKGGYVASGTSPSTGETAVPADLKELAILQCCHLFKRRDDIGLSSVSAMGGNVSVFAELDLLPLVKDGLRRGGHMRLAI